MKWEDVRLQYPGRWLLIEAIQAHSEANNRILDQIFVVEAFADSPTALEKYKLLHHQSPARELYVFHTDRKELDITERIWLGIRTAV
jgi:hypothetical protein